MEVREQRGLLIAATARITRKGGVWLVPSQSHRGRHTVSIHPTQSHCTCPDHEENGGDCKHIHAVRFVIQRELFEDDEVPPARMEPVPEPARRTYGQDWSAYNRAQTTEKSTLQVLLYELCKAIPETEDHRRGRPRLPIRDAIFSAVFKVYSTLSGRRFTSDLCDAHENGFLTRVPHFNPVLRVFEKEETTAILRDLVAHSAAPLAAIESNFAVDSTGFSGCRYDQWYQSKWKNAQSQTRRAWVKAHAMIGALTNVVTAVEVLDRDSSDITQLLPLMDKTSERFKVGDLCADKAYLSEAMLQAVTDRGATPLIPFKINSKANHPGVWNTAYHFFSLHREEFAARYHQRSNVESTFSMIKRKFGDSVRAKNDATMRNEVLAKFVCHNLCCLIQAQEELGIDPTFGCTLNQTAAPKLAVI